MPEFGTVTFSDPPLQFTNEQVDEALLDVQQQTALLGYLEQETWRFLSKVSFSSFSLLFSLLLPLSLCRFLSGLLTRWPFSFLIGYEVEKYDSPWEPTADEEMFVSMIESQATW